MWPTTDARAVGRPREKQMIELFETLTAILLDPVFGAAFSFWMALLQFISFWTIMGWFL